MQYTSCHYCVTSSIFSHYSACHQLGEFYQAVERDNEKAKAIFKANCEDRDYAQSCFSLGIIHLTNKGTLVTLCTKVQFSLDNVLFITLLSVIIKLPVNSEIR